MQLGQLKNLSYEQVKKMLDRGDVSNESWQLYRIYKGFMAWPKWNGRAVINFREALQLTQFELATILGVDAATVARWEKEPEEILPPLGLIAMTHIQLYWPNVTEMMRPSGNEPQWVGPEKNKKTAQDTLVHFAMLDNVEFLKEKGILKKKIGKRAPISKEQIVAVREKLAMTREEFADFLDTSVSTVDKWETGRSVPTGPANRLLNLLEQDQVKSFDLEEHMFALDHEILRKLRNGP